MKNNLTEVRLHGRGGQGVKTASLLLAEAAMGGGKYIQGFSDYGPERAGAPVQGFTRISDEPIKLHNFITNPDVVIILDNTLIGVVPVIDGLADDGIVIINTNKCPADYVELLGIPAERIWTVDATQVSLDTIGRNIPNAPMLGAFIKATGLVEQKAVYKTIERKFGGKSREVVEKNVEAIERAMEEVVNG